MMFALDCHELSAFTSSARRKNAVLKKKWQVSALWSIHDPYISLYERRKHPAWSDCFSSSSGGLVCTVRRLCVTPPGLYITGPSWRRWLLLLPWQQLSRVSAHAKGVWDGPFSWLHPRSQNGTLDKKPHPGQWNHRQTSNTARALWCVCVWWMAETCASHCIPFHHLVSRRLFFFFCRNWPGPMGCP